MILNVFFRICMNLIDLYEQELDLRTLKCMLEMHVSGYCLFLITVRRKTVNVFVCMQKRSSFAHTKFLLCHALERSDSIYTPSYVNLSIDVILQNGYFVPLWRRGSCYNSSNVLTKTIKSNNFL